MSKIEVNKIICGDCLEVMKDWPDRPLKPSELPVVDDMAVICITDPPYGINADTMKMGSGRHDWDIVVGWDSNCPEKSVFDRIRQISDNQVIWGGNYFTEYLPPSMNWLVWDKKNPNLSFSECELAWVYKGRRIRIFHYYSGIGGKVHLTEKPLPLMIWCVENHSNPNDLILDPFCGSGTTCVAAKMLGRKFIGIDISEEYCEIARMRLKAVDTGVPVKEQRQGQQALFPQKELDK